MEEGKQSGVVGGNMRGCKAVHKESEGKGRREGERCQGVDD